MKQRKFDVNENLKGQVQPLVFEHDPDYVFISTKDKNIVTVSGKYNLPNISAPLFAAKRNIEDGHFVMLRKSDQVWQSRDIAKKGWQDRVISIEQDFFGEKPHAMIGERQTMRELYNTWNTLGVVMLTSPDLPKGEVVFCISI